MVTDERILHAGDDLGGFCISGMLERDALADVYLAHRDGSSFNLRCLDLSRSAASPAPGVFEEKLRRLKTLRGDGIPAVVDGGIHDGRAWIATEHAQGSTLRDLLKLMSTNLVTLMLEQALEWAVTIRAAHDAGFLHGDLRPESVVFDDMRDEPRALVTGIGFADLFGLSRSIAAQTPVYRAPEQLRGEPLDARADIYSVGMILYEMLALRPPFRSPSGERPSLLKLRTRAMLDAPLSLLKIHRAFPKFVAGVIERAIAKDPRERPQRMDELIDAIEDSIERVQVWADTLNAAGEVSTPERERIKRLLQSSPAREAQSGHRVARRVQFGLLGYADPPIEEGADTYPGGPPEMFVTPTITPAPADSSERDASDGPKDAAPPTRRDEEPPTTSTTNAPDDAIEPAPQTLRTAEVKPRESAPLLPRSRPRRPAPVAERSPLMVLLSALVACILLESLWSEADKPSEPPPAATTREQAPSAKPDEGSSTEATSEPTTTSEQPDLARKTAPSTEKNTPAPGPLPRSHASTPQATRRDANTSEDGASPERASAECSLGRKKPWIDCVPTREGPETAKE